MKAPQRLAVLSIVLSPCLSFLPGFPTVNHPSVARRRPRSAEVKLLGKKNSGKTQQDLAAKMEAIKRAKAQEAAQQQASTIQYEGGGDAAAAAAAAAAAVTAEAEVGAEQAVVSVAANAGWRRAPSKAKSQKEEEARKFAKAFEEAVASDDMVLASSASSKYSSRAMSFAEFENESEQGLSGGSKSISYLKVGEPAPLEVWTELSTVDGEPASFWGSDDAGKAKPLAMVVTHYREGSGKLKEAVDTLNKKLPRKSFPADVKVVARDTPAATRRLAKTANIPGAKFYSASAGARGDAWCWSHGITPQLAEFGVSVFLIEAATGTLFAVSYDCDPLEVVAFAKKAVAVYIERQQQ